MLISTHVVTGALLGRVLHRPLVAAAAGVVSHFALDRAPHWGRPSPPGSRMDEFTLRVAVIDGVGGLLLIAAVAATSARHHRLPVLAGVVGACLPDLDKPGELFFGRSPFPAAFDDWHARIQPESADLLVRDVVVAVAAAAALLSGLRVETRLPG